MKRLLLLLVAAVPFSALADFQLESPDKRVVANIKDGGRLEYSVTFNGKPIILSSPLQLQFADGKVWGENSKVLKSHRNSIDQTVASPFYRSKNIDERYNNLILDFKGGWSVEFRAYNDGVAYRFIGKNKKPAVVTSELVNYKFPEDAKTFTAYVKPRSKDDQYYNSFENDYREVKLSELDKSRLILTPVTVDLGEAKVTITESDLESYPGLYMISEGNNALSGRHARYPKTLKQGGHKMIQRLVEEREDYIAKGSGNRTFPWRVAIITDDDRKLAASNLSYLLASPSRVADTSWIRPGKVAWDWWNNWNLTGVDFKAGVNNDTYKYYIDFAARNGIEYVILDEGWAVENKADLLQVVPAINIKELCDYAKSKGVGIVLWAGSYAFERDMENICKVYSQMGVKGFKIDFLDRDDQEMVEFVHSAARMADKYHLFLDFHGMYKPAGLNRTYPNVLNFEGVNGLEQMKWSTIELNQPEYDVTIPFLRQVAGPMDYTPGAMRNGTKKTYQKSYNEPMSQGTRCHQLALFIVYDSPFTMLSDTPINYDAEPESRDFIAAVPTVWDETRILQGKVGDYIVTARRKGDTWYVGGLTDWTPRELAIDLSFLGEGKYNAEIFRDGVNASKNAADYKREKISVDASTPIKVKLAPGGGFAIKITK